MSVHSPIQLPKEEFLKADKVASLKAKLGGVGILCVLISLIWAFMDRSQFAFSYLQACFLFFTILAGCMFWVLLHHATNSGWSVVLRRQEENLASLMPVLLVLFVPLIFVAASELYSWMRIPAHESHILEWKRGYLNQPFFWFRSAFYFGFFIIASAIFRKKSILQDKGGNVKQTLQMQKLSYAFMPLFGVSITFAGIDWLMGLDYLWFSTMWGVYIFAGAALSSMAVLVIVFTLLTNAGYLQGVVHKEHFHMMGKFLLTFSIFWAYIGFSQYMLIWYANIPEETSYFLRRNTEDWQTMSLLLVIGHFFVPFLLLLNRTIKKIPNKLSLVACWILLMHWLDIYIIVMPMLHTTGVSFSIVDVLPVVGIGCLLAMFLLQKMGKSSLFPVKDPRIIESIRVTN